MRYFLDTEFYENGSTIDLISIGIVAEDGRQFYACSTAAHLHAVNPWVREHVLPHLPPYGHAAWRSREAIKNGVHNFLQAGQALASTPEIWAYFADYDWVVFCQLFGTMMDLPERYPRFCMDLKQWAVQLGIGKSSIGWPAQTLGMEHDALADAEWNKRLHGYLSHIAAMGAQR